MCRKPRTAINYCIGQHTCYDGDRFWTFHASCCSPHTAHCTWWLQTDYKSICRYRNSITCAIQCSFVITWVSEQLVCEETEFKQTSDFWGLVLFPLWRPSSARPSVLLSVLTKQEGLNCFSSTLIFGSLKFVDLFNFLVKPEQKTHDTLRYITWVSGSQHGQSVH